jgi:glycosyltransferase involved in cell wall biosynthesis
MKVLHIEMGKHLYGGARQVAYLIDGLNKEGIESILLTPKSSAIAAEVSALGNKVIEVSYSGDLDIRLAQRVKKHVLDLDIDLVHVHSRRGADIWGGVGSKWAGVPAILSRRVDNPEGIRSIKHKYALYAQVITISEGIKEVLIENGLSPERISCVRSAFIAKDSQHPMPRAEFLQRFHLPANAFVLATVAQLIPRKGHELLINCLVDLLGKHTNMHVLFFGDGAEKAALAKMIETLGLSNRLQLVGFHDDLNILIGNIDLLVHPAYTEGLGVSLIQASAASVPIVASNVGGIPEIVRDNENGLLVPPGDQEALTAAIDRLAGDKEFRNQLGARGKQIAEKEFSVEIMVKGNIEVYRKVLGKPEATGG